MKNIFEDTSYMGLKSILGGGLEDTVVFPKANNFYYACNEIEDEDEKYDCMLKMKQKYYDIQKKNNEDIKDPFSKNDVFTSAMAGGYSGAFRVMSLGVTIPIFALLDFANGKIKANVIDSLFHACYNLKTKEAQESCMMEINKMKSDIMNSYLNKKTNRTDETAPTLNNNSKIKENASNLGWKYGASSALPVVGPAILNTVVNTKINNFDYACSKVSKENRDYCKQLMKEKYKEIMVRNELDPEIDPVPGKIKSALKGTGNGIISTIPGLGQFNLAASGILDQDSINLMEYACRRILDPQKRLDCQRELFDYKRKIQQDITDKENISLSSDLQESFNYHISKFKKK